MQTPAVPTHLEPTLRVPTRSVVAMLVAVGLQSMVWGALAPVLPLYVLLLGADPAQWGLIASSGGLVMIFTEPAWGWLADRVGLRDPYRAAQVGTALSIWLLFLWPGMILVVLSQLVNGVLGPANGVIGRGYLIRAYSRSHQMLGLSVQMIVGSVCSAIGSTLGGRLYQTLGADAVFLFMAVAATLCALATLLPSEPPPFPEEPRAPADLPADSPGILSGPLAVLGVIAIMQFFAQRLVRSFFVIIVRDRAGLDPAAAGLLLGLFGLANVAFLLLFNRFGRRLSLSLRIVVGLIIGVLAMLLYAVSRSFSMYLVAVVVDALGWALSNPARIILVGRLCRPSQYGRALGLHGAFENVGLFLGPLLGGLLWGLIGPVGALQSSAAALAIAAGLALKLRRQPQPGVSSA